MEKFKLDIYLKEKGKSFSFTKFLDEKGANEIIKELLRAVNSKEEGGALFTRVGNALDFRDFDEDYTNELTEIFKDFDFDRNGETFIVWDEKKVDKIESSDLIENWDFVWFGESDEAVILYQKERQKVLLINHYGRVCFKS